MERNEEEKIAVVEEIVKQLGGRRFILMTGAYDFLTLDSGVSFKLPVEEGFTKHRINFVEIILTPMDTYHLLFKKGDEIVSEHEGIYNDQLQELFTSETGLDTHL